MPKYLFAGSYTAEGLDGLLKEGGSSRREGMREALEGLGGTLEVFYYAFGDVDVFAIADLPDNVTAAALSLVVNAAGTAVVQTTVLMTPEEVDQAVEKSVDYRPPGR